MLRMYPVRGAQQSPRLFDLCNTYRYPSRRGTVESRDKLPEAKLAAALAVVDVDAGVTNGTEPKADAQDKKVKWWTVEEGRSI